MNVVLYSTGCPKCTILEKKMDQKSVNYVKNTNVDLMQKMGFTSLPMLDVDGNIMDFKSAITWVNELGDNNEN